MKKATTTKELEIRTTLLDSGFKDIKKRLDKIEIKIDELASTIDKGIGGWKTVIAILTMAAALVSILKLMK
jgi:tetrahydromethanopterin S-methyltransferase subunit G